MADLGGLLRQLITEAAKDAALTPAVEVLEVHEGDPPPPAKDGASRVLITKLPMPEGEQFHVAESVFAGPRADDKSVSPHAMLRRLALQCNVELRYSGPQIITVEKDTSRKERLFASLADCIDVLKVRAALSHLPEQELPPVPASVPDIFEAAKARGFELRRVDRHFEIAGYSQPLHTVRDVLELLRII